MENKQLIKTYKKKKYQIKPNMAKLTKTNLENNQT